MTDTMIDTEEQFVHYPFGALLLAYKSDIWDRCYGHYGSQFIREEFTSRNGLELRVAELLNDEYDEEDMEVIVFVDATRTTARIARHTFEWSDILSSARRHIAQVRKEAEERKRRWEEEKQKRAAEKKEKAERTTYERLKAKFEGGN